ncbi:hypothetical protein Anas_05888, partial [Armadillidium nasatum]
ALVALLAFVAVAAVASLPAGHIISKRAIILDENLEAVPIIRTARTLPVKGYGHAPPPPGKVGPVYTFVKTNYDGNYKWGVRHNVGYQFAG